MQIQGPHPRTTEGSEFVAVDSGNLCFNKLSRNSCAHESLRSFAFILHLASQDEGYSQGWNWSGICWKVVTCSETVHYNVVVHGGAKVCLLL